MTTTYPSWHDSAHDRDPYDRAKERISELRTGGMNVYQVAQHFGVNSVQIADTISGDLKFSPTIIRAVLGEEWGVLRVAFRCPDGQPFDAREYPPYIVVEMRRCPITNLPRIPRTPNSIYDPDHTTPTQRRRHRRERQRSRK